MLRQVTRGLVVEYLKPMALLTNAELKELEKKCPTIGMSATAAANSSRSAIIRSPKTPAEIFAHYRSLSGDARTDFYAKHSDTLWDFYYANYATQTAAR
jgi:hypothetical protein